MAASTELSGAGISVMAGVRDDGGAVLDIRIWSRTGGANINLGVALYGDDARKFAGMVAEEAEKI